MSEENKALARRAWELADNPDMLDEVYTADVVWHEPDQEIRGLEQAKQFVTTYKTAFPDMNVTHWQADRGTRRDHQPHRRRQDSRGLG
jgi:hypothetical protein